MEKSNRLLIIAPIIALLFYVLTRHWGLEHPAAATAAMTLLCAFWWITEPIPIPVTSLLPLAGLPLLGVLDTKEVALAYGSPLILLMLGGAMLSKAMESSGAHKRVALGLIHTLGGGNAFKIVLGFMLAAALLSMWISNTATALMLLPVALAVIEQAEKKLAVPLLLGIAYGCSIGGLGTPIGTPPNIIFLKVYQDSTGQSIGFLSWMGKTLPIILCLIPFCAWWLCRKIGTIECIQIPSSGKWTVYEQRVLTVFAFTALAWVTMDEPFGGWKSWFNVANANYGSIALIAVIVMFICPRGNPPSPMNIESEAQRNSKESEKISEASNTSPNNYKGLLDWTSAKSIEWGVLLLFAGGIALAKAFVLSGLSDILAQQLQLLTHLPPWLMILAICLGVTFLTEVTSNTATATLLMPVLAAAALAMSLDPAYLMIPAALSASCAFMMPVATPPNAIAFASGKLSVKDMVHFGLVLNIAGALTIALFAQIVL